MSDFYAEPYENEFGQVIKPGDEVVFVATSWQTKIKKGIFRGVFKGNQARYVPKRDESGALITEEVRLWNGHTIQQVINERVEEYVTKSVSVSSPGRKWDGKEYVDSNDVKSTLLKKRVFKIDTSLSDLNGKVF